METTISREDFEDAVLPLQSGLMRLALGLTRDASEARDLVQDALERALREWARFTPGTNARAWVSAILSRMFIDRWRRRQRQPRFVGLDHVQVAGCGFTAGGGGYLLPDGKADDAPAWDGVTDADLGWAIAELPDKLREVFELNVVQHLSYHEISHAAGIPVSTVGTRLLRARRQLRGRLEHRLANRRSDDQLASIAGQPVRVPPVAAGWSPPQPRALGEARQSARRSMSARASDVQGVTAFESRPM